MERESERVTTQTSQTTTKRQGTVISKLFFLITWILAKKIVKHRGESGSNQIILHTPHLFEEAEEEEIETCKLYTPPYKKNKETKIMSFWRSVTKAILLISLYQCCLRTSSLGVGTFAFSSSSLSIHSSHIYPPPFHSYRSENVRNHPMILTKRFVSTSPPNDQDEITQTQTKATEKVPYSIARGDGSTGGDGRS